MPDLPDETLMDAYARGDARAFEALYTRHEAGLFRFVRRVLGSALAAQADEVFQDTWLRVVNARAGWRPQGASFRTWLYTLAQHRAIDMLRRGGRELSIDGETAPWSPDDDADPWQKWPQPAAATSEDRLFWRRAGERLLRCLDELPVAQRSAFLMHHDDGLPLAEVAGALEVGFETAKTRLRYAMTKLRVCMGAHLAPLQGVEEAS